MPEPQKYVSTDDVLHGCLASFGVMFIAMLLVSLVFTEWLGWLTGDGEKTVTIGVWLVAICVGGYVATRRSKTEGFKAAFLVGALAMLYVLSRLPEPHDGALFAEQLEHVVLNPGANWRHIVALIFTLPAAVSGGMIALRNKKSS
jgi:hypothetical protein